VLELLQLQPYPGRRRDLVHRKRPTALVTDIKTMITDLNPDTAAG
jgi:hypothetical protein